MVDTGAESTWINATALEGIGIERRKKDLQFQLANGQIITRSVGYAVLTVDKSETVDEVVFAETGDLQLLGARALEGLNLQVDARRKRLVAAGPIVSAAAVPPRFGRLVQVPPEPPKTRLKDPGKEAETACGDPSEDEWPEARFQGNLTCNARTADLPNRHRIPTLQLLVANISGGVPRDTLYGACVIDGNGFTI